MCAHVSLFMDMCIFGMTSIQYETPCICGRVMHDHGVWGWAWLQQQPREDPWKVGLTTLSLGNGQKFQVYEELGKWLVYRL